MNKKEMAKFFSGIAVNEVVNHAVLAASDWLPLNVLGFTITANYNFVILVAWGVAAIFLIHYAWFKK